MISIELLSSEERIIYDKQLRGVFNRPDSSRDEKEDQMKRLFDEAVLSYFTRGGIINIQGNINTHNMDDKMLHKFLRIQLHEVARTLSLGMLRDAGAWLGKEIVKKHGTIFHTKLSNRNIPWDSPHAFNLAGIAGKHRLGNGKY